MRVSGVSFDVIGRDCLEAAAECGAEVVAAGYVERFVLARSVEGHPG
jgi:hypothetical protein